MNVFRGIWNFWLDVNDASCDKDFYVHLKDGRNAILVSPFWDEIDPCIRCEYIKFSDNSWAEKEDIEVDDIIWASLIDSEERFRIEDKWRYSKFLGEAVECNFPETFDFLRNHGVEGTHAFTHVIATGRKVAVYRSSNKQKEWRGTIMQLMPWEYGASDIVKQRMMNGLIQAITSDLDGLKKV